jgi:membrane protein CcdC involved in cytochrome C biogenesis
MEPDGSTIEEMPASPLTSIAVAALGSVAVLLWRVREGRSPVTAKKIIIPPLGMATGFGMFVVPMFRVPWPWALGAFVLGATLLAYPLIHTTRLTRVGDTIMMSRSKIFFAVIIVLAAIRLLARGYIGQYITLEQTAGVFFILAFGMILSWRVTMFLEYRRMVASA